MEENRRIDWTTNDLAVLEIRGQGDVTAENRSKQNIKATAGSMKGCKLNNMAEGNGSTYPFFSKSNIVEGS